LSELRQSVYGKGNLKTMEDAKIDVNELKILLADLVIQNRILEKVNAGLQAQLAEIQKKESRLSLLAQKEAKS
jgi:hypothetical protein